MSEHEPIENQHPLRQRKNHLIETIIEAYLKDALEFEVATHEYDRLKDLHPEVFIGDEYLFEELEAQFRLTDGEI
ncbi:MAG TPA: hypothetical protein VFP32_00245 [Candidatus Saccharimonadales bacterium]|nr:hypothetical protein [Candidatus Saccharimonadales bacterium]